ncbi:MAG: hypothetical protein ACYC28_06085 [Longimicrobiales bacterium]
MSDKELEPPVVALPADLMFASRIRGTAQAAGIPLEIANRPDALRERIARTRPRRVLIDLDARGWDPVALIRELRQADAQGATEIVAWVSHVRTDAIEAAREAGADRVLARSAFSKQMQDWLRV